MDENKKDIDESLGRELSQEGQELSEGAKDAAAETATYAKDAVADKVSDVKDAVADKAADVKDAVADKATDAKDAVADKATDAKDAVADKAADAKDAVADKATDAKDAVADKATDVKDTASDIKDEKAAAEAVKEPEKELTSEAVAGAAGGTQTPQTAQSEADVIKPAVVSDEYSKIVWPTAGRVWSETLTVIIVAALMAATIFFVDLGLRAIIEAFMRIG